MSTLPKQRYTPEQYLAVDRAADYKSEYLNGEIFAMGGASARHSLIVVNVSAELRSHLRERPCAVYATDLRVRVSYDGLYAYPDVVVACGAPQFLDDAFDTLINPIVIAEVLSPTTKNYDRGEKLEQYRKIASLQEYLLIYQDEPRIGHYLRQRDDTLLFSVIEEVESAIHLPSLDCTLALSEIYAKVDFGSAA